MTGPSEAMIDPDELADLAASGCTLAEVAAWYRCSVAQVRDHLKDPVLSDIWKRRRARGRAHLRRAQFKLAEKNTTMALQLGRQLLGQNGNHETGERNVTLVVNTGIDRDGPPGD